MGDTSSGATRVPRVRWTEAEDALLMSCMASGGSVTEAARQIGRGVPSVYSRREYLLRVGLKAPPKPTTKRPCLKCRVPFKSEGFHNRLCVQCLRRDTPVPQYMPNNAGFRHAPRRPE